MAIKVGISNSAKTISDIYVGVNNTKKKVSAVYIGTASGMKKVFPETVTTSYAYLISGADFNETIKQTINSSYTYKTEVTTLGNISIRLSEELTTTPDGTLSTSQSDYPIYFKTPTGTGTLLVWTKAEHMILPVDASFMFYNFNFSRAVSLVSLENDGRWESAYQMFGTSSSNPKTPAFYLNYLDSSSVTNMSQMFSGQSSLAHIYVGSGWDVSNVTNSTYMFYKCSSLPNFSSSVIDKTMAYKGGYLE